MGNLLEVGAVVSDRYRIVATLGEGGMGTVFRVEHVHMHKSFALKVLRGEVRDQPEVVQRFEREARAAGSISHPHVAAATDFGRLPDGAFFLVMEYVDGRSLRKELESKRRIEPPRALHILRGILGGVEAAHAAGIVHRDLKPENIMLVERDGDPDFVKVLDFGVAKLDPLGAAPEDGKPGELVTQAGAILGTPEYMAPEQALGKPVDARTDLYAIGVIVYEMLAGVTPFTGDAVALVRGHVLTEAPEVPDEVAASPALRAIVKRLLAKEPEQRFASAKELRAALLEAEGLRPSDSTLAIDACPSSPPVPQTRRGRSRKRWIAAAVGTTSLLGVGALAVVLSGAPSSRANTEERASSSPATAADASGPVAAPAGSVVELADDEDDESLPPPPVPNAGQTAGAGRSAPPAPTASAKGTARKGSAPAGGRPRQRRVKSNDNVFQKIGKGLKGIFD